LSSRGPSSSRYGSHVHNSLLVAGPDGRILRYAKRKLGKAEVAFIAPGHEPNVLSTTIGQVGCLLYSDGNDAALRQNIVQAGVDLVLVPQAIGATERLGRLVEAMEEEGRRPLWGPIVRELGAPAVTAGLVGVFENPLPEGVGDYLRGGTYVIDAAGRGLAHVPFPEEGVAVAAVSLGSERMMS
jgi:predicted amidohydrolase